MASAIHSSSLSVDSDDSDVDSALSCEFYLGSLAPVTSTETSPSQPNTSSWHKTKSQMSVKTSRRPFSAAVAKPMSAAAFRRPNTSIPSRREQRADPDLQLSVFSLSPSFRDGETDSAYYSRPSSHISSSQGARKLSLNCNPCVQGEASTSGVNNEMDLNHHIWRSSDARPRPKSSPAGITRHPSSMKYLAADNRVHTRISSAGLQWKPVSNMPVSKSTEPDYQSSESKSQSHPHRSVQCHKNKKLKKERERQIWRPSSANNSNTQSTGNEFDSKTTQLCNKMTNRRARSASEPKSLQNWQHEMNKAASLTQNRRVTKDQGGNYTSAHMLDAKLKAMPAEKLCQSTEKLAVKDGKGHTQNSKPWKRRSVVSPRRKQGCYIDIQYEKTIPRESWGACKPMKYVKNHKYGTHFEVRIKNKKAHTPKPGMSFLWENNCQVWLMEKVNSGKVPFHRQAARLSAKTDNKNSGHLSFEKQEDMFNWKNIDFGKGKSKDDSNIFDQFCEWSSQRQKERKAVVIIQAYTRGWLLRTRMAKLKTRVSLQHGCNWVSLCNDYKALLARIQRRCGEHRPSTPFSLDDITEFLNKKEKYEAAFHQVADADKTVPRSQLAKFFRQCSLFPTERQIQSSFRAVFKGCGIQSDVVFLLDCSASIGQQRYDMQLHLVRDIIGHCDVTYDKVRVAVIPYNDDVFRVIDFDEYASKDDLLSELADLTYETVLSHGKITRTDLALQCMTEIIAKANAKCDHVRDGARVPKVCITFTDGNCYHTQLTAHWAGYARDTLQVSMYLVNCSNSDPSGSQFLDITGDQKQVLGLTNYHTLKLLKAAIQGQNCLQSCPLCHFNKQLREHGGVCSDEKRGLYVQEALEILWMIYCPPATGLKLYKESLWMTPQIESNKPFKLKKFHPSGTDYRAELRKSVQKKLEKMGKIILPTDAGVKVREVNDVDIAMDLIDKLCISKLSDIGLLDS